MGTMHICGKLVSFVLRQYVGDVAGSASENILTRFADHSGKLLAALDAANEHAWRVLELSLADDGFWSRLVKLPLTTAEERAFREQLRAYLDSDPMTARADRAFRQACLADLKAARNAGLLSAGKLAPLEIANQAGSFGRFESPAALMDGAWAAIGLIADSLADAGFDNLARLLRQRSSTRPPILVAAFSFFLRREVEKDAELSRGLTFDQLREMSEDLDGKFAGLERAFNVMGGQITELLDNMHTQVDDIHGAVHRMERNLGTALADARSAAALRTVRPPELLSLELGGGINMDFVLIPSGEFLLGSPVAERGRCADEGPQQRIRIAQPFYLSRTPVTQEQWQAVLGFNPSKFQGDGKLPVQSVQFRDCVAFCDELHQRTGRTARLPSEAEWEYACRAGTVTAYSFGDEPGTLDDYAWYNNNASGPRPVAQKLPNAWGLHDMHGNVWEWCQDTWHNNYIGIPLDARAWVLDGEEDRGVLRGGSWSNGGFGCRSASRGKAHRSLHLGIFGCRIALAKAPGK